LKGPSPYDYLDSIEFLFSCNEIGISSNHIIIYVLLFLEVEQFD
jgi:hypothetical protein